MGETKRKRGREPKNPSPETLEFPATSTTPNNNNTFTMDDVFSVDKVELADVPTHVRRRGRPKKLPKQSDKPDKPPLVSIARRVPRPVDNNGIILFPVKLGLLRRSRCPWKRIQRGTSFPWGWCRRWTPLWRCSACIQSLIFRFRGKGKGSTVRVVVVLWLVEKGYLPMRIQWSITPRLSWRNEAPIPNTSPRSSPLGPSAILVYPFMLEI